MITAIIVTVLICCALVVIRALCKFGDCLYRWFNGSSTSYTGTDPHTYVDARKLPHSSKKSSHENN